MWPSMQSPCPTDPPDPPDPPAPAPVPVLYTLDATIRIGPDRSRAGREIPSGVRCNAARETARTGPKTGRGR